MGRIVEIDAELVRELVAAQFPQWADLPVTAVEPFGWDHRTFRLGAERLVRLPSAARYAPQVDKEQQWLPMLAPHLPVAIPEPLARGGPGAGYLWPWSIYRWIPGANVDVSTSVDLVPLAKALGGFLVALQRIDPTAGPRPGLHNFFRGGPRLTYDGEMREPWTTVVTRSMCGR